MGLIREPLDVDFTVDPRILTKAEKNAISEYIRNYKIKEAEKKTVTARVSKAQAKTSEVSKTSEV